MNKQQMESVLNYLDTEYAGIVKKMTDAEKVMRAKHLAMEIGPLDYNAVMTAIRKLAKNAYMPRTAEIIAEVEKSISQKPTCRIFRDANGDEVLDLRHSDGSEFMSGYLKSFPEWMQLKFRWQADPTYENTLAWDSYILAHEND